MDFICRNFSYFGMSSKGNLLVYVNRKFRYGLVLGMVGFRIFLFIYLVKDLGLIFIGLFELCVCLCINYSDCRGNECFDWLGLEG